MCFSFFDDILIYIKNKMEHISHVRKVLEILRSHQLYAKVSKCTFMAKEVECENLSTLDFIQQAIYLGNWKPILDNGLIQFFVVNAHMV